MRTHGTLTKWNDDRGFGFITPAKGPPEIFVHISEFPRESGRPMVNELISFEVVPGPDGRQRAVRIMRPGQKSARPPAMRERQQARGRWLSGALTLLAVASIGAYTYSRFMHRPAPSVDTRPQVPAPTQYRPAPAEPPRPQQAASQPQWPTPSGDTRPQEAAPRALPPARCDGRKMCSQMNSCEEATYFIRNCPDTQMDGDHDGVPCESQWCK